MNEEADTFSDTKSPPVVAPFKYAVIDLASAAMLRPAVTNSRSSAATPLFAKELGREMLGVGPWLVRLSKAPEIERTLNGIDTEVSWGYYVYSTVDIVSLRQSLRRFNLVQVSKKSKPMLFRYWDPRVMRVFLDVATKEQQDRLFEWIERFEGPNENSASHPADAASKNSTPLWRFDA